MTYTLELNHINPTRPIFFHQTGIATSAQALNHITPILEKHVKKGTWAHGVETWTTRETDIFELETGGYQLVTRIHDFVSIASAIEFFKDDVADGAEYRRLKREWNQANGILNETNVLDEAGNVVEVVHACQAHKCVRFGSCPSVGSGCATVPEHTHDGIYPIYHINPV